MTKLTENFSLEEMTKTNVKGVNNAPDAKATANLYRVCGWLEELRSEYNKRYGEATPSRPPQGEGDEYPIIINSAFRCPAVNKAVGGSSTSNHLTGCAADIRVLGMEQLMRYATILLDIADEKKKDFDEIILERSEKSIWLHFAVRPDNNRRKVKFMSK